MVNSEAARQRIVVGVARLTGFALKQLLRVELDLVGVDAGGRCEGAGDDLALREQALHLGVDQAGAELIEIENARNEDGKPDQIEDDDAPRQAGEAMAEGQTLPAASVPLCARGHGLPSGRGARRSLSLVASASCQDLSASAVMIS